MYSIDGFSSKLTTNFLTPIATNSSLLTVCLVQKYLLNDKIDQRYKTHTYVFKVLSFGTLTFIERKLHRYGGAFAAHAGIVSIALALFILRKAHSEVQDDSFRAGTQASSLPSPIPNTSTSIVPLENLRDPFEVKRPEIDLELENSQPILHPKKRKKKKKIKYTLNDPRHPKFFHNFYHCSKFPFPDEDTSNLPTLTVTYHKVQQSISDQIFLDILFPSVITDHILTFLNQKEEFNNDIFNLAIASQNPGRLVNYLDFSKKYFTNNFEPIPFKLIEGFIKEIKNSPKFAESFIRIFFKLNLHPHVHSYFYRGAIHSNAISKGISLDWLFKRMVRFAQCIEIPTNANLINLKKLFKRRPYESGSFHIFGNSNQLNLALDALSNSKIPIKELELYFCPVLSLKALKAFLDGAGSSIKKITFNHFELSSPLIKIIVSSQAFKSIDDLDFYNAKLNDDVTAVLFNERVDVSMLKTLNFQGKPGHPEENTMTHKTAIALAKCNLSSLKNLTIVSVGFDFSAADLFGKNRTLGNLETLILHDCFNYRELENNPLVHFMKLLNLPMLKQLDLSGNWIFDSILNVIGSCRGMPSLEIIKLCCYHITPQGIINLIKSPLGTRLKEIHIREFDDEITDTIKAKKDTLKDLILPAIGNDYYVFRERRFSAPIIKRKG